MFSFPDAIHWVLLEMMRNTKDHSGKLDAHLVINIDQSRLVLMYSDNGIGVDDEYVNHIFEPFFYYKAWVKSKARVGLVSATQYRHLTSQV